MNTATYSCTCLTGTVHYHTINEQIARDRGIHSLSDVDSNNPSSPNNIDYFGKDIEDALRGALWGIFIADALASPLHWYYTWSICQQHKEEYYHSRIQQYTNVPSELLNKHPDSYKYFQKCNPLNEPILSIFNNHHDLWSQKNYNYHGTLPQGDNTLTTRIITSLLISITNHHGLSMDNYFAQSYLPLFTGSNTSESSINHNDTWIDETHRIFFRNVSKGVYPYEAGMDDVCLTGLALSTPIILSYLGASRSTIETALRCVLQITHKAEDMIQQSLWYSDLLQSIGTKYLSSHSSLPTNNPSITSTFEQLFRTFSNSQLNLSEILQQNLTDEQVYHGNQAIFSSR